MPDISDIALFYSSQWEKDGSPSSSLLADKGTLAKEFLHPATKVVSEEQFQTVLWAAMAEAAEALRNIAEAAKSPRTEARTMSLGGAALELQRAEARIRSVLRN